MVFSKAGCPCASFWSFPPSLRSVGNAAVSGDCLLPSLRSGREPGSQDGLALRAAAYRRILPSASSCGYASYIFQLQTRLAGNPRSARFSPHNFLIIFLLIMTNKAGLCYYTHVLSANSKAQRRIILGRNPHD